MQEQQEGSTMPLESIICHQNNDNCQKRIRYPLALVKQ